MTHAIQGSVAIKINEVAREPAGSAYKMVHSLGLGVGLGIAFTMHHFMYT